MIFDTLRPHADAMVKTGKVEESCFVLDSVTIDFDALADDVRQAKTDTKTKRLTIPVVFDGRKEGLIPSRFQISNAGNAANQTFKKLNAKLRNYDPADGHECPYPLAWFPWLGTRVQRLEDFVQALKKIIAASSDELRNLFAKGNDLYTFSDGDTREIKSLVAKTVCYPVSCKQPTLFVHSLLALNCIAENSELFGFKYRTDVISAEALRFCLLFWAFDTMKHIHVVLPDGKPHTPSPAVEGIGTAGDISRLWLVVRNGKALIGQKVMPIEPYDSVLDLFYSLIQETEVDRVLVGSMVYTAPATGKSPTNAFRSDDNINVIQPAVMKGFSAERITPVIDGYGPLVKGTRFSFGLDGEFYYYVFPESTVYIADYLKVIQDHLRRLMDLRKVYFSEMKKSVSTAKQQDKKKELLARIRRERSEIWGETWSSLALGELLFAIEENVGSTNQKQFTWTVVYHHLEAPRTYLFLHELDDPASFGQAASMLKETAKGHNHGAGWAAREKKGVLDDFFCRRPITTDRYWLRWRGYFLRSNQAEQPVNTRLWEDAMAFVKSLQVIDSLLTDPDWDGQTLLKNYQQRKRIMQSKQKDDIRAYLGELFHRNRESADSEKTKKLIETMNAFLDQRAGDYARFVDTNSPNWKTVIDGLISGWGLKKICLKLRPDDYKSVIGGRSLVKQHPSQIRTLAIGLLEKANRAGTPPWNIDVPMEILMKWSLQNQQDTQTVLFTDALGLGFLRFDHKMEQEEIDQ